MNEKNNSKSQEEKVVDSRRATVIVKGNVQKVGYRDCVYRVAESLEIKGSIENLTDGNVKIVAEGESKNLEEFINRIRNFSSPIGWVNEVIIEFGETKNEFEHFNIEHSDMASEISENLLPILLSNFNSGIIAMNKIFQQLSVTNKKIEKIESILTTKETKKELTTKETKKELTTKETKKELTTKETKKELTTKETKKKRSQRYVESKIGQVLIFGPGRGSKDYRYRENVREILEEYFETVFPEDFDSINDLMDWYKEHGISLTENQVKLLNGRPSSVTKELILADYCSYVYIILMSPGAISEFSHFYLDQTVYKMRVFIPMEYYKSDSYISSGPLKVFGDKYKHVHAFEDESELLKLVKETANSDFEYEYIMKRKTTTFPFAI
jgi:acylphosphatase